MRLSHGCDRDPRDHGRLLAGLVQEPELALQQEEGFFQLVSLLG